MFYRKNVGGKERWSRLLTGALIVACALTQVRIIPLGLMLAGAGVFTALTGLVGFCPVCAVDGRKPVDGPR
ncbi:MAG: DUF2892 domain-containing protein [Pseudomonadota bacterium]